jgi:hypothetical protein
VERVAEEAEELRSLSGEGEPAPQEIAGGAQLRRIDVGPRDRAGSEQDSELLGVDAVVLALAAVTGLKLERVGEHELDAVLSAEIGEPQRR